MAVKRTVLGPGHLIIDPSTGPMAFESQVTNCRLVPSVDTGDAIPVLSGERVAGDRTESFTLQGSMIPDFGQEGSLQEWLFTNRGKTMDFEFVPRKDLSKQLVGSLVVEAVEIGGDVTTSNPVDFEFQVLEVELGAFTPVP